ncbi:MAG: hypothetical protein NTX50_15910, partial [Candidatus Sumerlaeota bacterium]|nr:hypothetical protein [Candidatus Sumerlaeota bacterium]
NGEIDLGRYHLRDEHQRILPTDARVPNGTHKVHLQRRTPQSTWIDKCYSESGRSTPRINSIFFLVKRDSAALSLSQAAMSQFQRVGIISVGFHDIPSFQKALREDATLSSGRICGYVADTGFLEELGEVRGSWPEDYSRFPQLTPGCSLPDRSMDKVNREEQIFNRIMPSSIPWSHLSEQAPAEAICEEIYRKLLFDRRNHPYLAEIGGRADEERKRVFDDSHFLLDSLDASVRSTFPGLVAPITKFVRCVSVRGGSLLALDVLREVVRSIPELDALFASLWGKIEGRPELRAALKKMFDLGQYLYA